MLDVKKLMSEIEAGRELAEQHPREDMHESELQHFRGLLLQGDTFGALTGAFVLGFKRGHRIGQGRRRRCGSQLAAMRELATQAVAECKDADLLDLVYKMIVLEAQA